MKKKTEIIHFSLIIANKWDENKTKKSKQKIITRQEHLFYLFITFKMEYFTLWLEAFKANWKNKKKEDISWVRTEGDLPLPHLRQYKCNALKATQCGLSSIQIDHVQCVRSVFGCDRHAVLLTIVSLYTIVSCDRITFGIRNQAGNANVCVNATAYAAASCETKKP